MTARPFWHCALFVGLTLFLLAIPLLSLLAFGDRAQAAMPKARDWMNNNSWVVSEAVIGLFVAAHDLGPGLAAGAYPGGRRSRRE